MVDHHYHKEVLLALDSWKNHNNLTSGSNIILYLLGLTLLIYTTGYMGTVTHITGILMIYQILLNPSDQDQNMVKLSTLNNFIIKLCSVFIAIFFSMPKHDCFFNYQLFQESSVTMIKR